MVLGLTKALPLPAFPRPYNEKEFLSIIKKIHKVRNVTSAPNPLRHTDGEHTLPLLPLFRTPPNAPTKRSAVIEEGGGGNANQPRSTHPSLPSTAIFSGFPSIRPRPTLPRPERWAVHTWASEGVHSRRKDEAARTTPSPSLNYQEFRRLEFYLSDFTVLLKSPPGPQPVSSKEKRGRVRTTITGLTCHIIK